MDYPAAERYLQTLTDYEKSTGILYSAANYDLRRMRLLLSALGDPDRGRRTVHIAGTKGKGSTAAMLSIILTSAGYCTGRFTSPHLFSWQERIAVNERSISKKDFARLATLIEPEVRAINGEERFGRLTTFEALTAMAFCYFRGKKADFQVLETGMGGRLDSTNVVERPDACIITSISLDHTQVLGNTISQIAREKAGIIKRGCAVISAPQPAAAMAAIKDRCRKVNAPLLIAGRDLTWTRLGGDLDRQTFSVRTGLRDYKLSTRLLGDYQMENAALAVAAAEALQQRGIKLDCAHIVRGVKKVTWPARLEILNRDPLLVIDSAHNSYSVGKVIESIRKYFHYRHTFIIFGSSQDKDIEGMLKELSGFADHIVLVISSHPRAATTEYLLSISTKEGLKSETANSIRQALSEIWSKAGKNDLILGIGSLFVAAAIKETFNKKGEK